MSRADLDAPASTQEGGLGTRPYRTNRTRRRNQRVTSRRVANRSGGFPNPPPAGAVARSPQSSLPEPQVHVAVAGTQGRGPVQNASRRRLHDAGLDAIRPLDEARDVEPALRVRGDGERRAFSLGVEEE